MTNESGSVTDTLVFDAFGNETAKTGSTDNSYGFQGEEKDETGLYYLRARYMDPATGTFTSMDTYGGSLTDPMSLHKYLFANSNPVAYCDPSGNFSMTEQALVCGLIGELASAVIYTVELLTTDNIKYNSWWEAGYGALRAVLAGFTAGVVMWALHTVFAAIVGTAIAAYVFGSFGAAMSILGIFDAALDWGNGDTDLGTVKVVISVISLFMSVYSINAGVKGYYPHDYVIKSEDNGKSSVGASKYSDYPWYENEGGGAGKVGRSKNDISPNSNATGDHVVYKKEPVTGEITNYTFYKTNPRNPTGFDEVIRYDGVGDPHYNPVTKEDLMPHVHDKTAPGKVRPPYQNEIPGQ